jgi:hypothetical protein
MSTAGSEESDPSVGWLAAGATASRVGMALETLHVVIRIVL